MSDPLAHARPGPALQAELLSLSGNGQLFVDYTWLHGFDNTSGPGPIHGNCISLDPTIPTLACGSAPGFAWTFTLDGPGRISLTPSAAQPAGIGRTSLAVTLSGDLLIVALACGWTGYKEPDDDSVYAAGERDGGAPAEVTPASPSVAPASRLWLLKNVQALQPDLPAAPSSAVSSEAIRAALAGHGMEADSDTVGRIRSLIMG